MPDNQMEAYNRIQDKVDKVSDNFKADLLNYAKKDDLQHYATKDFVWRLLLGGALILCGAYWLLTPVYIDSKNSKFNESIEKILEKLNISDKKSQILSN